MNNNFKQGFKLGFCMWILTCAACGTRNSEPPADEMNEPGERAEQVQESDMDESSIGEILNHQVSGAISDLSSRTGMAADNITVTQASSVHWGSAALGCPKEGMVYTQAIVPGVLVILEIDGVFYRYHGRTEGKLTYCPEERAQEPAYGPGKEFM